jgi:hypothetical protein
MSYSDIPIIVVLWTDRGYGGTRCPILRNTPDLTAYGFNDRASSIGVHPGPTYKPNVTYPVACFEDHHYHGFPLVLEQGAYPALDELNFNDKISSVRFYNTINAPSRWPLTAAPIGPIPLVVELYEHKDFKGRKLIVIENIANLGYYAGFDNTASSLKVYPGPNYTPGSKVRLFRNNDFQPKDDPLVLGVGWVRDLAHSNYAYNDMLSSIAIT